MALLLVKYAMFGVIPLIVPSMLIDKPIRSTDSQPEGTDLEYIRHLADQAGYVFYIDPGPVTGISTAYWGPQIKVGPVQPALNVDMDAYTNVENLHFNFDQEKNRIPVGLHLYPADRRRYPIPIPPITPLNPPLGLIPPLPTNILGDLQPSATTCQAAHPAGHHDGPGRGRAICRSSNLRGQPGRDAIRRNPESAATGGRTRRRAGLRRPYYVKSVTHKIKRGEYKQNFTLTRNGLVSTVPTVNP